MNTNSNTAVAVAVTVSAKDLWWTRHGGATLTSRSPMRGWAPVFLGDVDWAMQSVPHAQDSMPKLHAAEQGAALVVLRDDGSRVWHIRGLDTPEAFFAHYGLSVSLPKGIGPLMKRLSRILVDFRSAAWLKGSAIHVQYLNYGAVRSKAYDGSAKVSRRFVVGVAGQRYDADYRPYIDEYYRYLTGNALDRPMPSDVKAELTRDLEQLEMQAAELSREAHTLLEGEFTFLLGAGSGHAETGLFKGQATVIETDQYDVLLPRGAAKPELALAGDRAYFGIKPISPHDHLFIDRQSLTNLNTTRHPDGLGFFSYDPEQPGQDRLITWLKTHLDRYQAQVAGGEFNQTLSKHAKHLAWESDAEQFLGFFLHRFVAMGGDVRWFRRTLAQAYGLGLAPIERRFTGTSYPVPGLRLYVRPQSMADYHVRRGECAWNLERGVIYVSEVDAVTFDPKWKSVRQLEDWLAQGHALDDLTPGLMPKLGGYDGDDAFNVIPFIDFDGKRKALISRSPNMPGERWILNVTAGEVPEGLGYWFHADSRRLADFVAATIDPEYAIRPFAGTAATAYSLKAVNQTARKMVESRAAVGMFCLMVRELILICGDLPPTVPAYAEQVIDACSKNFEDVSGVIQWTRDIALALVAAKVRVPDLIYDEFVNFLPDDSPLPAHCPPNTHWIDKLTTAARAVLQSYKDQTFAASNQATPPAALFEHALGWAAPGRGLRSVYGRTMYQLMKNSEADPEADDDDEDADLDERAPVERVPLAEAYEIARAASEAYLAQFNQAERPMVCVGGLAEVYLEAAADGDSVLGDEDELVLIHDNAFFQLGEKLAVGREGGIDALTLEGLAAIGILHDLRWDNRRLIVEQARIVTPLSKLTAVHVAHGWFNYGIALGRIKPDARMAGLDKLLIADLKAKFARVDLRGLHFKPEMRRIPIGPKTVDKPVLVSQGSGKILGIVHGASSVEHLPPVVRIVSAVHATDGDNSWFMLASD